MDVTVTNISTGPVYVSDLYTTLAASGSVTFKRSASELSAMVSLQKSVALGLLTVAAQPEAYEVASGLMTAPGSVDAGDLAAVDSGVAASGEIVIRKNFTTTASTDIVLFAANQLPYKIRILDAYLLISTAQGSSTLQLFPQAAGGGTAITTATSSAATGRVAMPLTNNQSQLVWQSAQNGLFLRPSAHSGVVGEVVITARRETGGAPN